MSIELKAPAQEPRHRLAPNCGASFGISLLMILPITIVQDLSQTVVQSLQNIEDSLLEPSFFEPDAFRIKSNEKQPKSKVKSTPTTNPV